MGDVGQMRNLQGFRCLSEDIFYFLSGKTKFLIRLDFLFISLGIGGLILCSLLTFFGKYLQVFNHISTSKWFHDQHITGRLK